MSFIKDEERLKRKFAMFRPVHISQYTMQLRSDEGEGFPGLFAVSSVDSRPRLRSEHSLRRPSQCLTGMPAGERANWSARTLPARRTSTRRIGADETRGLGV
jgi:hypothetical protein